MARIPVSVGSLQAGNARVGARATPQQFGAGVAAARVGVARRVGAAERRNVAAGRQEVETQTAIGNAVGGATDKLLLAFAERQEKDQRVEAVKLAGEHELRARKTAAKLANQAPEDGGGHVERVLKSFDDSTKETLEGAKSTFQRRILEEQFLKARISTETRAVSFELAAQKRKRESDLSDIIELNNEKLLNDPDSFREVVAETKSAIAGSNVSAALKRKLNKAAEEDFTGTALQVLIQNGNLAEANKLLKEQKIIAALGVEDTLKLRDKVKRAQKAAADLIDGTTVLADMESGVTTVDPNNNKARKAVDKAYKITGAADRLKVRDVEEAKKLTALAVHGSFVPDSAVSVLRGMALNGTEEDKVYAYQTFNQILSQKPGAVMGASMKSIRDDSQYFQSLVTESGLAPDEAIKRINETHTAEFKAKSDVFRKTAITLAKDLEPDLLTDDLTSNWFFDPEVGGSPNRGEAVMSMLRERFIDHYIRTGDEATAKNVAVKEMKNTYAESKVLDKVRIMRRPPEKYYPSRNGNIEYFSEQLVAEVEKETGTKVLAEDIYIEAVNSTEQDISVGRLPGYGVVWADNQGNLQDKPGFVFRAVPPSSGPTQADELLSLRRQNKSEAAAALQAIIARQEELDAESATGLIP